MTAVIAIWQRGEEGIFVYSVRDAAARDSRVQIFLKMVYSGSSEGQTTLTVIASCNSALVFHLRA